MLWSVFLNRDWCGRARPTAGSAAHGQVVIGGWYKKAVWANHMAKANKQCLSTASPRVPASGLLRLKILPWLSGLFWLRVCELNKPFPHKLLLVMVFTTATENKTRKEVPGSQGAAVTNHVLLGRLWRILELWAVSVQSSMNCCGKLEDDAESGADDGGLAYQVSGGSKNSWGCSCDILN